MDRDANGGRTLFCAVNHGKRPFAPCDPATAPFADSVRDSRICAPGGRRAALATHVRGNVFQDTGGAQRSQESQRPHADETVPG
jgi:hypothetical protein